jgi:hypothetical protein
MGSILWSVSMRSSSRTTKPRSKRLELCLLAALLGLLGSEGKLVARILVPLVCSSQIPLPE